MRSGGTRLSRLPRLPIPALCALVAGALFPSGVATAQQLVPVGGAFEIHDPFTDYNPHGLDVAMARDAGSFVVAWDESDVMDWLVRARRFDAEGRPLDTEPIDVNPSTRGYFSTARVAADAWGGFLVAWSGSASRLGGEPWSIWGRRFTPDGTPLAPEAPLNAPTSGLLDQPAVAMAPDGQSVAAWTEWESGVWYQRYDSIGEPVLPGDQPLPAEGLLPFDYAPPTVAIDPEDGRFVVVRGTRQGSSPSDPGCASSRWGLDLVGQRFSSTGETLGTPFPVLPAQPGGYRNPRASVAALGQGDFVAVWAHGNCTNTTPSIPTGRIVKADGSLSAAFPLTTRTGASPSVAADALGNFTVAWSTTAGNWVRRFDRSGAPLGDEVLAVPASPGVQTGAPTIASDGTGRGVMVWQTSRGVDTQYGTAWEHRFLGQILALMSIRRVAIDIRPGTTPNTVNLGSNGIVPVAILSDEGFDATRVDPLSVTLASAHVRLRGNGTPMASVSDVNRDGLDDLVVHVSTAALTLTSSDTTATLEGSTTDGQRIEGTDSVRIVR
jgi:hypothetical protein